MKYIVTVTDLHRSLVRGMHFTEPKEQVDVGRRGAKQGVRIHINALRNLIKCALDPQSVAVVSHPFHPWFALFAMMARKIELYDDGTAYYARSLIPSNYRSKIYQFMVARHFKWTVDAEAVSDYGVMLAHSGAERMHALYPDLLELSPPPVPTPIDRSKAFPLSDGALDSESVTIYLDTAPHLSPAGGDAVAVMRILEDLASRSTGGAIYYRAHPTGSTEITRILENTTWARALTGAFEDRVSRIRVECVVSYFSSGAISVKNTHPDAMVINLRNNSQPNATSGLEKLFRGLGASEIQY